MPNILFCVIHNIMRRKRIVTAKTSICKTTSKWGGGGQIETCSSEKVICNSQYVKKVVLFNHM